jgi:integrase
VKFIEPKKKSCTRTIVLDEITMQHLSNHIDLQQAERLAAGDRWEENGLIYTSLLGTPIHPRHLLWELYIILYNAGLPLIYFHAQRHYDASLLLNHDAPATVVSKRLGNARVSITEYTYGHLIPGMKVEAAKLTGDRIIPHPLSSITPGYTRGAFGTPNCIQ